MIEEFINFMLSLFSDIAREILRIRWIKKEDLIKMVVVVITISVICSVILYFENLFAGIVFKILKVIFGK